MIRSLQRGLAILEIIGKREQSASLADLSRELGLHPSTVFHLLKTLLALGFVAQTPGAKTYRLGPRVFQLASAATHEQALVDLAMPSLVELVRITGETSHLAIYDRGEVIVIAKLDGSGPLRLTERIGTPRPAHCTAIGKVLLAALTPAELSAHLAERRLARYTPRTITAAARLRAELRRVREQGYAVDDEEYSLGLRCLAAPVHNFAGKVVAALGLSAPAWRLGGRRLPGLAGTVRQQAARLSADLGHAEPTPRRPARSVSEFPSPPRMGGERAWVRGAGALPALTLTLSLPGGRGRKEKRARESR